jgi:hypothetical protein
MTVHSLPPDEPETTSLPPAIATLLQSLFASTDPTTRALISTALHSSPVTTNNHDHAPITPGGTTLTTASSIDTNNVDDDDPVDDNVLSQSDVTPYKPPPQLTNRINSSAGIITTAIEEQRAIHSADLQIQTRRATEGRICHHNDTIKRKCAVIKLVIPSNANSDQAPTTPILEQLIDAIILHLAFTFPIDIVALFNYSTPVENAKHTSSTYFSFAYLSPCSTQKPSSNAQHSHEFSLLYSRITDLLKYPNQAIHAITNLPPISQFVTFTIPSINSMYEHIEFMIDGIGP